MNWSYLRNGTIKTVRIYRRGRCCDLNWTWRCSAENSIFDLEFSDECTFTVCDEWSGVELTSEDLPVRQITTESNIRAFDYLLIVNGYLYLGLTTLWSPLTLSSMPENLAHRNALINSCVRIFLSSWIHMIFYMQKILIFQKVIPFE